MKVTVLLVALIYVCAASPVPQETSEEEQEFFDPHPQYEFNYVVENPEDFNMQTREESRDGEYVRGSYSILLPHGTLQVVRYEAGPEGYNAEIENNPNAEPSLKSAYETTYVIPYEEDVQAPAASVPQQKVIRKVVPQQKILTKVVPQQSVIQRVIQVPTPVRVAPAPQVIKRIVQVPVVSRPSNTFVPQQQSAEGQAVFSTRISGRGYEVAY